MKFMMTPKIFATAAPCQHCETLPLAEASPAKMPLFQHGVPAGRAGMPTARATKASRVAKPVQLEYLEKTAQKNV